MRKLKLQMMFSPGTGDEVMKFCIDNLKNIDNILLGRKTGEGVIPYWAKVALNPKDSEYKLGKPLADLKKQLAVETGKKQNFNCGTTLI